MIAIRTLNKMPKKCYQCICNTAIGKSYVCLAYAFKEVPSNTKPDWCPLVEVPDYNKFRCNDCGKECEAEDCKYAVSKSGESVELCSDCFEEFKKRLALRIKEIANEQ